MLPMNACGANRLLLPRQSGSRIGLMSVIKWKQASVAGVKLRRFTGHIGGIEVGSVELTAATAYGRGVAPSRRMSGDTLRLGKPQSRHSRRGFEAG